MCAYYFGWEETLLKLSGEKHIYKNFQHVHGKVQEAEECYNSPPKYRRARVPSVVEPIPSRHASYPWTGSHQDLDGLKQAIGGKRRWCSHLSWRKQIRLEVKRDQICQICLDLKLCKVKQSSRKCSSVLSARTVKGFTTFEDNFPCPANLCCLAGSVHHDKQVLVAQSFLEFGWTDEKPSYALPFLLVE